MLKKLSVLACVVAIAAAVAACKPAEPGKNAPDCKNGDASCDYTMGS